MRRFRSCNPDCGSSFILETSKCSRRHELLRALRRDMEKEGRTVGDLRSDGMSGPIAEFAWQCSLILSSQLTNLRSWRKSTSVVHVQMGKTRGRAYPAPCSSFHKNCWYDTSIVSYLAMCLHGRSDVQEKQSACRLPKDLVSLSIIIAIMMILSQHS
jgi:hypothetical protein